MAAVLKSAGCGTFIRANPPVASASRLDMSLRRSSAKSSHSVAMTPPLPLQQRPEDHRTDTHARLCACAAPWRGDD